LPLPSHPPWAQPCTHLCPAPQVDFITEADRKGFGEELATYYEKSELAHENGSALMA